MCPADLQRSAGNRRNDRSAAVELLDVDIQACGLKESEVLGIVRPGLTFEWCQPDVDDGRGLRGHGGTAKQCEHNGKHERSIQSSHRAPVSDYGPSFLGAVERIRYRV